MLLSEMLKRRAVNQQPRVQLPRSAVGQGITSLLRGVDLFAGAGGFTIGAHNAGCRITLAAQFDPDAVQTSRRAGHRAERMDVRELGQTEQALFGVEVLIGGPPCQPFSSMGNRAGKYDPRDGIPLFLEAIDTVQPRRAVFENVKNFLSPAFKAYRDTVMDDLGKRFAHVGVWLLNAKDYGVPQDRERVFVWGADVPLQPPTPTHGPRAGKPYKGVRQALPDLGAPAIHVRATTARSRDIGQPSPTVTTKGTMYTAAREGLIYGTDPARGRRLTVPELGALQGFPGSFEFTGNLGAQYKQVGNAVPPPLGEAVMRAMLAGIVARRLSPRKVLDTLKRENPEAWLLEPRSVFDKALVGVTNAGPYGTGQMVAVYDRDRFLDAAVDDAVGEDADEEEREAAYYEAMAYLDSIESGFYDKSKPYPWIRRSDSDTEEMED